MGVIINPYLNFQGTCEEAMKFYQANIGGELLNGIVRFRDMPMEGMEIPENELDKVMHTSLVFNEHYQIMASDALESMSQKVILGNNNYISFTVDSKEEADRVYNALLEGAVVEMPLGDVPWGSYFAMLKDKFGVQWMISYDYPQENQ